MSEPTQASFEGWAVVEMMGHRKEVGFVTTQAFGQAVMFRVDTPELPAREYVLTAPEYADIEGGRQWCPKGTKVLRPATPARSCLVAPASLYAINPCSEEAARQVIERDFPRPLIAVELPSRKALEAATEVPDDAQELDDSDICLDCGRAEGLRSCHF